MEEKTTTQKDAWEHLPQLKCPNCNVIMKWVFNRDLQDRWELIVFCPNNCKNGARGLLVFAEKTNKE